MGKEFKVKGWAISGEESGSADWSGLEWRKGKGRLSGADSLPHETMTLNRSAASGLETKLAVRVATEADTDRLKQLVNTAFSIETFLDGTRTNEESLAAMMRKGAILIAEDRIAEERVVTNEGRLIGCVYTEVRGERGYIGMLTVDPKRQRRGLSTRIMEAAEEHLRGKGCVGVDIIVLSLRTELPPIYRRHGYVETGTAPYDLNRTITTGEDCHFILMSKDL